MTKKLLVTDRKTGEVYDPEQKFLELMESPDFVAMMRRMKEHDSGPPVKDKTDD